MRYLYWKHAIAGFATSDLLHWVRVEGSSTLSYPNEACQWPFAS